MPSALIDLRFISNSDRTPEFCVKILAASEKISPLLGSFANSRAATTLQQGQRTFVR